MTENYLDSIAESAEGLRALFFETLDSTNEEAFRRYSAGMPAPFWIVAESQTMGRGRAGRSWQSPPGNLYASLLFEAAGPSATTAQLSFVSALAAHEAASSLLGEERARALRLKWPNDLLLDGAKVAGVLLESRGSGPGGGLALVIGFGINLASAPTGLDRPAASLGLAASPETTHSALSALSRAMDRWRNRWDWGKGFSEIRSAWLARAFGLNEIVGVRVNGLAVHGRFLGIDASGALQLETEEGVVVAITAGDVVGGGLQAP